MLLFILGGLCCARPSPEPPPASWVAPPVEVLQQLSLIATGEELPGRELTQWRQRSRSQSGADEFIEHLLLQPSFSNQVAPRLLMGLLTYSPALKVIGPTFILFRDESPTGPIYHLG